MPFFLKSNSTERCFPSFFRIRNRFTRLVKVNRFTFPQYVIIINISKTVFQEKPNLLCMVRKHFCAWLNLGNASETKSLRISWLQDFSEPLCSGFLWIPRSKGEQLLLNVVSIFDCEILYQQVSLGVCYFYGKITLKNAGLPHFFSLTSCSLLGKKSKGRRK